MPEMTASQMGRKGGTTTANRLTPAQRSAKAKKAAKARWKKHKKSTTKA